MDINADDNKIELIDDINCTSSCCQNIDCCLPWRKPRICALCENEILNKETILREYMSRNK